LQQLLLLIEECEYVERLLVIESASSKVASDLVFVISNEMLVWSGGLDVGCVTQCESQMVVVLYYAL
jgi:hypothetical protein